MSWKQKIGKLKQRDLGVIEVKLLTDPGLQDQLDKLGTELGLEPDNQELHKEVEDAEKAVKDATLIFRFRTLAADAIERLRTASLKDDGSVDLDQLMVLIMVEAYLPETGEDGITEADIADLKSVLTDQEWKQLYGAVITSSASSDLSWEKLGKG